MSNRRKNGRKAPRETITSVTLNDEIIIFIDIRHSISQLECKKMEIKLQINYSSFILDLFR